MDRPGLGLSLLSWLVEEYGDEHAWRARAACSASNDTAAAFFPERGQSASPARSVCAGCPVRAECLDYAVTNRIYHGVWGGLSEKERRPLYATIAPPGGADRSAAARRGAALRLGRTEAA